ncbi:MAG: AAA family ATPase [Bacteroidales bacterium]|nr:AAA family ATPase [Bacteroidales bacterium]
MIKEVYLENWKSFSPSRLYIDPLTVLIGTNASGKSNLLDALWFLSHLAMGHSVESIFKDIRGGKECIIQM